MVHAISRDIGRRCIYALFILAGAVGLALSATPSSAAEPTAPADVAPASSHSPTPPNSASPQGTAVAQPDSGVVPYSGTFTWQATFKHLVISRDWLQDGNRVRVSSNIDCNGANISKYYITIHWAPQDYDPLSQIGPKVHYACNLTQGYTWTIPSQDVGAYLHFVIEKAENGKYVHGHGSVHYFNQ